MTRLSRLMCGKAFGFRGKEYLSEATPQRFLEAEPAKCEKVTIRKGKSLSAPQEAKPHPSAESQNKTLLKLTRKNKSVTTGIIFSRSILSLSSGTSS